MRKRGKIFASWLHFFYASPMETHCNAADILMKSRLSVTAHRLQVLSILVGTMKLMSSAQIADRLRKCSTINRVTLYRMLTTFKDAGIIREITPANGPKLYEVACRHNPIHPHFFCVKCQTTACLPSIATTRFLKRVASASMAIDTISIHLSGVCAKCHTHN